MALPVDPAKSAEPGLAIVETIIDDHDGLRIKAPKVAEMQPMLLKILPILGRVKVDVHEFMYIR